jgi:hypothetical protein
LSRFLKDPDFYPTLAGIKNIFCQKMEKLSGQRDDQHGLTKGAFLDFKAAFL